jgi:hypothetical protein
MIYGMQLSCPSTMFVHAPSVVNSYTHSVFVVTTFLEGILKYKWPWHCGGKNTINNRGGSEHVAENNLCKEMNSKESFNS